MDAKEARKLTINSYTSQTGSDIERSYKAIKKAAANCQWSTRLDWRITDEAVARLEEDGFEVEYLGGYLEDGWRVDSTQQGTQIDWNG